MIGNNSEPGITASVESMESLAVTGISPGTPLLVGGADLESGNVAPGEVVRIDSVRNARRVLGEESSSHLTRNVLDALSNGAAPVLAVACPEEVRTMDLSALAEPSAEVANPVKEDMSEVTVTLEGSVADVRTTLHDVGHSMVDAPAAGEAVVNLATGGVRLESVPSAGSIEYTALDYGAALDATLGFDGDFDFLGVLKEGQASAAVATAKELAQQETLVLAMAGAHPYTYPGMITVDQDDSRLQLVAPSRSEMGYSLVGAVAGKRAEIGLDTTLINQGVEGHAPPAQSLSRSQRSSLIDKYVTPMKTVGASMQVKDDLTTVNPMENSEEAGYRYGFSRLAVDFLIGVTFEYEQQFVGEYNSPGVVGQLEDLLTEDARPLVDSAIIFDYDVSVSLVGPTQIQVDFRADVAEPIRFIDNDFTIGQQLN